MVGRPTGQPKTGGRKKGTLNKTTKKRRALTEKLVKGGDTPLEVILAMMRGKRDFDANLLAAAVAAAPYVHPKLSAIEHTGDVGGPFQHESITNEEIEKEVAERFAAPERTGGEDGLVH